MKGISKSTYFLYTTAAALTPAATRKVGPKFGREELLHMSVCVGPTIEERHELLGRVTPIHVEGE
jgi:hypothetical protein